MNFSIANIFAGIVFGTFGWYFWKRGGREQYVPYRVVGALMMAYPYFIDNDYLLWIIGIILMVIGFKIG